LITGFGLALLAAAIGFILALGLAMFWIGNRVTMPLSIRTCSVDPILGARDRVAIYDSHGPFISMPDNLKTHQEIVAWMTKELPKLTAQATAHPNEKPRA
jgi:hypothetical protein